MEKVRYIQRITREEELECAKRMKDGDSTARERLIEGYLHIIAAHVRRAPQTARGLSLVFDCLRVLEREVDSFNFFHEGETFTHRLCLCLRQTVVRHVVK